MKLPFPIILAPTALARTEEHARCSLCPTTLALAPWAGKVIIVQRSIIAPTILVDKMECAFPRDTHTDANASTASTDQTAASTSMNVIGIHAGTQGRAEIHTDLTSKC